MNGVALPNVVALYRTGGIPEFGNSEAERGRFVPKAQTPESSLAFVRGMLDIGRDLEARRGLPVFKGIFSDLGNYSYPILAIQARRPLPVFLRYCLGLVRMGFWKSALFYAYALALIVIGPRGSNWIIGRIKVILGRTPVIGNISRGRSM
jgi:hypothetical protein